ncbi:hypothetical protein GOBAR_AA09649 [Gossypium barbadense]|uniref:SLC26A/SulP transporter domain-containing protein n=1 Tax=Gossypium barbadense TaxID=3634 RepID=A0A2P5Y5Z3_GOSBA|nr:hypothetical protein GOBAR_AA09649 [Gossypium barbadense]
MEDPYLARQTLDTQSLPISTPNSSFVPPLIYAFMGSLRDIAIGPVAVVSLLLGTLLQNEIDSSENPVDYRRLAFTATFFAGITQFTLGFFRLVFFIDFLSHAAIVGFMAVWSAAHHGWNWETILIGMSFLAFLLVAKYIGKKKKLFWVPAIDPLISVVLSTFFMYITRSDKHGVQIECIILSSVRFIYDPWLVAKVMKIHFHNVYLQVKHFRRGINPSSLNEIFFSGEYLAKGFRIGVLAGMIALTEAVVIGRTFASMKDYQLDGNKEMVALGTMNVVGSMTSFYMATGMALNCGRNTV